ncbi:MAG: hypothetical protein MJ084_06955 [Saccharofermentans sp.]|nr:hypothetical protein [Saccharofermentans sp.]
MNLKDAETMILQNYGDVVTISSSDHACRFFSLWYGTIPIEVEIIHEKIELTHLSNIGRWRSRSPYLKPTSDYEEYLYCCSLMDLEDCNGFCMRILPEKYLTFYYEGFKPDYEAYCKMCDDICTALVDSLGGDVTNIVNDGNVCKFIVYETLSLSIEQTDKCYSVRRHFRDGYSVVIHKTRSIEFGIAEAVDFVYKYSYSIIPDEWIERYSYRSVSN